MKRRLIMMPLLLVMVMFASCSQSTLVEQDNVIEIGEKLFIAHTNEIYMNKKSYLGKTIKYQGLFKQSQWVTGGADGAVLYNYVIRYGPGCCGDDGDVGFEVVWDGEYPEINDWVEVVGTLEEFKESGNTYLRLRLDSLTVLEERGAEVVQA